VSRSSRRTRSALDPIVRLVIADLRARYAGSALGLSWSALHPLALVLVYTAVFSRLLGPELAAGAGPVDYSVFLCAGLLPWIVCQDVVVRSTTVFVDQAALVKNTSFPKGYLHGSIVGTAGVQLSMLVFGALALWKWWGQPLPAAAALWPLFVLLELSFAAGIGIVASVAHVFFRDTAQILSVVLQLWFWLTPIVYPMHVVPEALVRWLRWNPLYHFVRAEQGLLLPGALPAAGEMALLVALAVAAPVAGALCVRAAERRIPDEI
jgi:lipopolysaccharide transport system permease protein